MIEVRILGPLEVVRQGRLLEIGSGKQRALLAVLVLHANEVVSTDRLIDELWGERAPATAPKIVQGYVSGLRKALAGETGSGGSVLVTRRPGYVLRLEDGQLDADRFAALLARARAALEAHDPLDASALLHDALALWRGPPLGDFAFDAFAQEEIARLEELHVAALEERIDADLELGREAGLVAELETLVARHPLRERLRGQLMLALYRCGRQTEALQVYQEARRVLVQELGLEPGRALQQLEQAILRQDPALELQPPPAAPPAADPARADLRGSVFVGRERELAALRSALEDAVSGRGRLLVVGGEPGIGKSRLAAELAALAPERGAEVLWGRCWEEGGAPPYWPWVQALRSCVDDLGDEQLQAALGPGAAEIAALVPEVSLRLPDVRAPSASADPQQARFRLFDSVAGFLQRASRSRPLVLVVDDLHWADEGSLLLLEFVARELADARVLVIGTYRDIELSRVHPLSKTLSELARELSFERLVLRGLSDADVARFIEATWSIAPDQALVHALRAQTEGNPFFVGEVVRLLTDEGALQPGALEPPERWTARVPEGVREAIGRRLERLSGPCNETLTVASVIGREFDLFQLTALIAELSEDQLLEALEEALAAHLVDELADAGRYQFTHALIQRTLADEISRTRRTRLHGRIAEALEGLYGDDAGRHAAELAHHFAEAQALLGPGKLVHYSGLAGESALAAHAPEQALAHFQRALVAKGDEALDDEAATLLFGLGRAQLATLAPHELEPAVTSLRRAFEHYAEAGDLERAVGVAASPLPLSLGLAQTRMGELNARGLVLVTRDSPEEGRLLVWRGWFSGLIDADYEAAQRAFARVGSIAEREHDLALLRIMLANAAFVDAFHLRLQECLGNGLRACELAQDTGDLRTEMAARRAVAWALCATGHLQRARVHTAAALAHGQKLRESWWLTSTAFSDELLCLYEGDWRGAFERSELGLAKQPRDPRHLALRAVLHHELGELDAGAAYIAQLREVAERAPPPGPIADHVLLATTIPLVGRIAGSDEGLDVAEAAAEHVLALPRLAPVLATYAMSGLALIAVQRRDADAAERLYAALEGQRGTANFFVPLTSDRLLGLLAATFGDLDASLAHFAEGIEFCARGGYRPEQAWTALAYADTLLRRAAADDEAQAVALQGEALEIADELGMRSLAERVLARRGAAADLPFAG